MSPATRHRYRIAGIVLLWVAAVAAFLLIIAPGLTQ